MCIRDISLEERIRGYEADSVRLTENTQPNADGFSPMVIHGKHLSLIHI